MTALKNRHSENPQAPYQPGRALLAGLIAAFLVGGCASQPAGDDVPANTQPDIVPAQVEDHKSAPAKPALGTPRRAMGAFQIAQLGLRTWYLDPIVRPFSTQKTAIALALKSAGGLMRRAALATVQFNSLERQPLPPLSYAAPMDLVAFERDLDRIGAGTASRGRIALHVDGAAYFPRLMQAIEEAEESIDLRTYIFDNDDVAVSVADLLKARSRDLKVRVMLDGVGVLLGEQVDPSAMPEDFHPPLSMAAYLRQGSGVKVRVLTNPWLTGDHSKTTIMDGKTAFIGGMNIGREYRYDWHDLMMEVTGPVVHILERDSDKAWQKGGMFGDAAWLGRMLMKKKSRTDKDGYPVRVLFTRDHNSQIYRAQLKAARSAQSYILIENPYFSDDLLLYELARARRRGVDVRVILSRDGNHGMLNLSNELAVNKMLRNGIRVYRYPGMVHTKAAVFDGWACLGSANLDKLSLQVNDEINLATSDPQFVNPLLEQLFLADLHKSEEITAPVPIEWKNRAAEVLADDEALLEWAGESAELARQS